MYSCWWLWPSISRWFACWSKVSGGKFMKCFFSFSALSTFLFLISAPTECSPSSVITGLQMLIIPGWCNMVQGELRRQQNVVQSFSFKSKDIWRLFFLPYSSYQACIIPDNAAQQVYIHISPNEVLILTIVCESCVCLANKKTQVTLIAKQSNCFKVPTVTENF